MEATRELGYQVQGLTVRTRSRAIQYKMVVDCDVLPLIGEIAREYLSSSGHRVLVVSNPTVFGLYGQTVETGLKKAGFSVAKFLVGDGERFKTLTTFRKIVRSLSDNSYERSDGVLALGGGVVGDLAGFAAGVYLRGIPFLNVPTSLLAQIDSSVGGKTGVNLISGKNLLGVFHQPVAVIADLATLRTLPRREFVSGSCEMVKQAAVANKKLFKQTSDVLQALRSGTATVCSSPMKHLVAEHCRFKASIVANDEREEHQRNDNRSRKILNFGHTFAHALEAVTKYRRFLHGEAVGIGVVVAATISNNMSLLTTREKELLVDAVDLCGPLPNTRGVDIDAVLSSVGRDKKTTGGETHWVLLQHIGHPQIVKASSIPRQLLRTSVEEALAIATDLRS